MTACTVRYHPNMTRAGCPTFAATAKLDGNLLVHVLAQVQDVFLLGALRLSRGASALGPAATAASATVAASPAAAAPECASLRHGVGVEVR